MIARRTGNGLRVEMQRMGGRSLVVGRRSEEDDDATPEKMLSPEGLAEGDGIDDAIASL